MEVVQAANSSQWTTGNNHTELTSLLLDSDDNFDTNNINSNSASNELSKQALNWPKSGHEHKKEEQQAVECGACKQIIRDRWIMRLWSPRQLQTPTQATIATTTIPTAKTIIANNRLELDQEELDLAATDKKELTQLEASELLSRASECADEENNESERSFYHESCLKCSLCSQLLQVTCFLNESKLFCHNHYFR